MAIGIALVVIALIGSVVWAVFFGGRVPKTYAGRACEGAGWRRAFPDSSSDEIRTFLLMFVDAFAFRDTEKLKFSPNDRIMDIYRALYPSRGTPDALEVETLALQVERKCGLRLATVWREELTLGELFQCLRK
jgi:hypothetical protein